MKIRSITYFTNPGWPLDEDALSEAATLIARARASFEQAGYEVQTTRLATIPFPQIVSPFSGEAVIELAQALEGRAAALGFDYISLGPALPPLPESYALIPKVLAVTQNVFFSGLMSAEGRVSLPAVRACAEVIHQLAPLTPDGFANLRFAALGNVPPGVPFFPAAYHEGERPLLALALEAADLAVEAFSNAPDLETGRRTLIGMLECHAHTLSALGCNLAHAARIPCGGMDFSLAPFPHDLHSLGAAFEHLGVPAIGLHGSLAAAAILADTIDQARFVRAGFSGLMMPVLEDTVLARRAAEGTLTVNDLLLYSAVCGAGLDTVPLPGDTSVEELYAVLLDVAALAQRLGKPLTARLMPIPGKRAGDPTRFDFAYFANSRVMTLRSAPLAGLLAGRESVALKRRPEAL